MGRWRKRWKTLIKEGRITFEEGNKRRIAMGMAPLTRRIQVEATPKPEKQFRDTERYYYYKECRPEAGATPLQAFLIDFNPTLKWYIEAPLETPKEEVILVPRDPAEYAI